MYPPNIVAQIIGESFVLNIRFMVYCLMMEPQEYGTILEEELLQRGMIKA